MTTFSTAYMAAVAKRDDPQTWFGTHRCQAQHVLVEVRQLLVVFCARATPAQAWDIHPGQYHFQHVSGAAGCLTGGPAHVAP